MWCVETNSYHRTEGEIWAMMPQNNQNRIRSAFSTEMPIFLVLFQLRLRKI